MTAQNATIWGTGLIGASMGMALRRAGWHVRGWDPDPAALGVAAGRGAIDEALTDQTADGADLLVLAGPTQVTIDTFGTLDTDGLVTDVAAVKVPVIQAAGHLPHFVGGHPMAGRAGSGVELATPNLFKGAAWILTTDGADLADLERMSAVAESLGGRPVILSARDHDRAVASISHLPHVLAAALVDMAAADPVALELVAGSFRDLTRVAASDAGAWAEILMANAPEVISAIEAVQGRLDGWRSRLAGGGADAIGPTLLSSQNARRQMTPDVARVAIPLADEPGELARVGRALESSGADIRDLQLRHAEHGGGGLLTLSVLPRDEEPLRRGLAAQGFAPETTS